MKAFNTLKRYLMKTLKRYLMKTSSSWRMIRRPEWMLRKQIFFRIHFHFFSLSKLTFPSTSQPCIQLNHSFPYHFRNQIQIFANKRWRSENICDDGGEQQRDKVATSLTLKVCCKRRGGEEGWEILDLLYPPSHYRISLSSQHFLWYDITYEYDCDIWCDLQW